jgi:hypothetical protein
MGAQLVARVLAHWTHLSDRPFRLLVRMAHTALDKPQDGKPAGIYFAGRELLAMTLRGGGTNESRNRAVARTVADLIDVGAIERVDVGRTGHNAVYRLTLDGASKKTDEPFQGGHKSHPETAPEATDQGGRRSHPQGGQRSHPKGGRNATNRVATEATPRNQQEPIEELYEEEGVEVTTTSHPSRATTPPHLAPVVQLFPKAPEAPNEPTPYEPPAPWSRRDFGLNNISEASARIAARREARQAQLAADSATEVS